MADANPLVLRGAGQVFTFADFEVPPRLEALGGKQLHAVHQFIGGDRSIQTYGPTPHERITWSGRFLGASGPTRARQFDALRQSGQQCTLTWGPWKYTGALVQTDIRPNFVGDIPYSAIFVPDTDASGQTPFASAVSPESAYSGTAADLAQLAASYGGSTPTILNAILAVTANLNSLSLMLSENGGLISAIPVAQLAGVTTALTGVIDSLAPLQSETILPAPPFAITVGEIAANYQDQLWAQQESIQLTALLYVLSLPQPNVNVQTFVDPNLLLIAAAVYGDPTKYELISAANGGFPIVASGTFTLVLPA